MSEEDLDEDRLYQIQIDVYTRYLDEQSSPEDNRYVFSYTITISNQSEYPAKLVNRHWLITDAEGGVEEVRGRGVVGEQPYLGPGEQFQYTSGTILKTPVGSMEGSYGMVTDEGVEFEAVIPPFSLAVPRILH
ncbi:Co2+/Mg2+ efflux protein ApaG [Magnetovirga frankeli]|uniref:Co2+/Mg2+ efflux protein ApaG n=1 Tax=Magnetovirga frankeli TaxID=947516 RepID=UPI001292EC83|nr:Co2+/Mg2+ efflux protein ApaG [gamma proteobacterium SS-5]